MRAAAFLVTWLYNAIVLSTYRQLGHGLSFCSTKARKCSGSTCIVQLTIDLTCKSVAIDASSSSPSSHSGRCQPSLLSVHIHTRTQQYNIRHPRSCHRHQSITKVQITCLRDGLWHWLWDLWLFLPSWPGQSWSCRR